MVGHTKSFEPCGEAGVVTQYEGKDGRKKVNGGVALKCTQAYPMAFGESVFETWLEHGTDSHPQHDIVPGAQMEMDQDIWAQHVDMAGILASFRR